MEIDKRKNLRVFFDAKVEVCSEKGKLISNKAKDISLRGLYVYAREERPDIGELCDVKISLSKDIVLRFKAKVLRHDKNGFALSFIATDLNSISHLKNLLSYNSPDPDKIEEELKELFHLK